MVREVNLGSVVGPTGKDSATPTFEIRSDGHLYAIFPDA